LHANARKTTLQNVFIDKIIHLGRLIAEGSESLPSGYQNLTYGGLSCEACPKTGFCFRKQAFL
jgi:hypothetical protein